MTRPVLLAWFGGKATLASWILPKLPPHRVYVEPFGGAMGVLLAKPPSPIEVYNDADGDLVHFWRVVRDPNLYPLLQHRLLLTPYSREEYLFCRETWRDVEDPVERAARWFITVRMSVSSAGALHRSGWKYNLSAARQSMPMAVSQWLSAVSTLPEVHARLQRVQIEHGDWRTIVDRYDTPDTLFYCDPPYVPDTRRSGTYRHELTLEDHEALVERLLRIRGVAALSGYQHPVYEPLERAGWVRYERETNCWAAARTRGTGIVGEGATWQHDQRRTECLWVSPTRHTQPTLWPLDEEVRP